jgi:hypothetical protein
VGGKKAKQQLQSIRQSTRLCLTKTKVKRKTSKRRHENGKT